MYVSTMLMLLVLMTYGRMESFRGFGYIQSQFKQYMEKHERNYINDQAIRQYKTTKATSNNPNDDEDDPQQKSQARAKLAFNLFIDKKERDAHQNDYEQLSLITRNLIYYLYSEESFYKAMEEKRPNFVAEILDAIIKTTDGYTDKQKLKKTCEISTINLGDAELNEVFTLMLKGSVSIAEKIQSSENVILKYEEGRVTVQPNYLSTEGYYSLEGFLTLDPGNYKIRVFLASPQLLMAIFGNPATVNDILQQRYALYTSLKKGEEKKTLESSFQNQYQSQILPGIRPEILDFGISKTNPKNYE